MTKKVWIVGAVLAGCSVGPNYKAPKNDVPLAWVHEESAVMQENGDPLVKWWEIFNDPLLNQYIVLAKERNNDVLTATSNILQARAIRQMTASSFFPQIGADVNATRSYFSKNGPLFSGQGEENSPFALQFPQKQSLYNAVLDVTWEIDLFGKTRRAVEAANARIGRAIEEKNDVLLSVMAEIASNYMELRGMQQKTLVIEQNIALLEKEAMLIEAQFISGYVNRLDRENSLALLAAEKAKLPEVTAKIHQAIYTLSILTGSFPEVLLEELTPIQNLPKLPEKITLGIRSDLLRRRPDVRKVERELAAATANIGVAVAAFFPSLSLIGDGGFQSLEIKNLFSLGSKTWAFGGDLAMPIFQGGKLIGNLKAKKAETAATAHRYQQTILKALEETESAIDAYLNDIKTVQERKASENKYREIVDLSSTRHAKGLVSLLNTIDAERKWNSAEEALLDSRIKALLDTIFLYKALGGGWQESP